MLARRMNLLGPYEMPAKRRASYPPAASELWRCKENNRDLIHFHHVVIESDMAAKNYMEHVGNCTALYSLPARMGTTPCAMEDADHMICLLFA